MNPLDHPAGTVAAFPANPEETAFTAAIVDPSGRHPEWLILDGDLAGMIHRFPAGDATIIGHLDAANLLATMGSIGGNPTPEQGYGRRMLAAQAVEAFRDGELQPAQQLAAVA